MSIGDTLGYLAYGNPISQALISTASSVVKSTGYEIQKIPTKNAVAVAPITIEVQRQLWELAGRNYNFVRLAGLSGAAAVIMGAYGKHYIATITDSKDQMDAKAVFETANRFHFLHTFALMAMPMAHKPVLTGTLMAAGTILFSGPMYYRALTGDKTFVPVATCGGFCLVAAWLTLLIF